MNESPEKPPRSVRRRQLRAMKKAVKRAIKQRRQGPGVISASPRRKQ